MDTGVPWRDVAKDAFLSRFAPQAVKDRPAVTLRDLKIADERGKLVSLVLNPVQRQLMIELGFDPDDPSPSIADLILRKRILKARREGITTLLMALFFLDTYNNANRRTVHVSNDRMNTESIFEMIRRFHNNLPAGKRRPAPRANVGELFLSDIDSSFRCGTAGTANLLSGSTLHNLHKSERAKWPGTKADIDALDASLDEACRLGNIIEETTAQGFNWFREDYYDSLAGRNPYQAIFFPWWLDPRYAAPVPPEGLERTNDEEKEAKAFNLTNEQLQWYREKRAERGVLTRQEYPSSVADAFLSTGTGYFNRAVLTFQQTAIERDPETFAPKPWRRSSVYDSRTNELKTPSGQSRSGLVLPNDMTFCRGVVEREGDDKDSYLRVWSTPEPQHRYIIGADTAQGVTQGAENDFQSAHVVDCQTLEVVAKLHGRGVQWEPHQYANMLCELSWWYAYRGRYTTESALLVVERENHGSAVLTTLQHELKMPLQVGNRCSGVYCHDPMNITGVRQVGKGHTAYPLPGYSSTAHKKFWADTLAEYISAAGEPLCGIWITDVQSIAECLAYVHLPGGRMGGEAGTHDDDVTSIGLACAAHKLCYERPIEGAQNRVGLSGNDSAGYGKKESR